MLTVGIYALQRSLVYISVKDLAAEDRNAHISTTYPRIRLFPSLLGHPRLPSAQTHQKPPFLHPDR
jgi:hypothetical protein